MYKTLTVSQFIPVKQKSKRVTVASRVITSLGSNTAVPKRATKSRFNFTDLGLRVGTYLLVATNIAFLVVHVVNTNAYAVKGYEITRLRNHLTQLEQSNKKLSLEAAEITSIVGIQQSVALARFVPVTSTEFIKSSTPKVSER